MEKHREAKLDETLPLSGSANQRVFIPKNRQPIKRYRKVGKKKEEKNTKQQKKVKIKKIYI